MKYGKRVGIIKVNFVNKDARAGVIVFGDMNQLEGTCAEDYAYQGYTFYAVYKEGEYGSSFGGYVSSPKLEKEDKEYPPASFYIYINPYNGDNENIAYTCSIKVVDNGEFGDTLLSGVLFKGAVKGLCDGTISELLPDEDEDEVKTSRRGSKSRQPSSKRSGGSHSDEKPSSKNGTQKRDGSRSTKKKSVDEDEDILY
jgi:hypothetical protein